MLTVRKTDAGFTLTETMVVVVILSLLAALSTPMFSRDNNARKGRGWAKAVAQILQRARFQAMGDHANIHVLLYRTHIDTYRQETTGSYTLLASVQGPAPAGDQTIAIWDAKINDAVTLPTGQNSALTGASAHPTSPTGANDIVFSSVGGTASTASWRVFIRNELLPAVHPDASFVVNIGGLTGFITGNDKVTLP
jgi:prepilin-type N-terminal cleavage/methylation domain-containing protein